MYDDDLTDDLQHDLALALASGEADAELTAELLRRGAPLPVNCRWVHDPYARFGQRLAYHLP